MSPKPRVYLFHGNDAWSSSRYLSRWLEAFKEKFGESTRFTLDAGELTAEALIAQVESKMMGDALFAEPKLIVVRRIGSCERAPSYLLSKQIVTLLEKYKAYLDDQITLVFWEETRLAPKNPLLGLLMKWDEEGAANVRLFDVPANRTLISWSERWCQEWKVVLEPEARSWLSEILSETEIALRNSNRLKTGEILTADERVGWLHNLLSVTSLSCTNGTLTKEDLYKAYIPLIEAAVPFTLINTAQAGNWKAVFQEADNYIKIQDSDSGYYGFIAAMRWSVKQRIASRDKNLGDALTKWLAEWEMVGKNFPVPMPWLLHMFFQRWSEYKEKGFRPILDNEMILLMLCARS